MRIRSIKPEFWRSKSISSLPIDDRLLFIGLWSYVDDNGVGVDRLSLIAADLFADDLESDPRETFARVSRGLASLSEAGRIVRYTVPEGEFLSIVNWSEHQRIDKPGKPRYPAPTREDVVIRDTLATPSRESRAWSRGAGEQGSRGAEEENTCPSADGRATDFDTWWSHYPNKVAKGAARKAYAKAVKTVGVDVLLTAVSSYAAKSAGTDKKFIPYPATWLNAERWADEQQQEEPFRLRNVIPASEAPEDPTFIPMMDLYPQTGGTR